MAPKIFFTGVTGYIGGDLFDQLYDAHPDYDYVLLVRTEERAQLVRERYPKAHFVYGDLSDAKVFEEQAGAADLVIHTADSADDMPSAKAIVKGMAAGHSAEKPGRWIHLSGTGILQWYDIANKRYGEALQPDQKYKDMKDIDRIISLPDMAPHRNVDKVVLAANESPGVKTAVVGPPTIYGAGRGPGNQRSQQVNMMCRFVLHHGYAPIVGSGKAEWDNVHVHDLSRFFVLLAEAALDPEKRDNPDMFGPRAYYFVEAGQHTWREVAEQVAEAAHRQGFMAEPKTEFADNAALRKLPESNTTWAYNSQGVAERARKVLGWAPQAKSLKEEIPDIMAIEAEVMGIKPTLSSPPQ